MPSRMRRTLRIGLAASASHRVPPGGALFRLMMPLEQSIRDELEMDIVALEQTHEALSRAHVLAGYAGLSRLPHRRDGGLLHLIAAVVSGDPERRLDALICLLDPEDPAAASPELAAVKRACMLHETPFVSTLAHAQAWFELARIERGFWPDPLRDADLDYRGHAIALCAHDARKSEMVAFCREHFTFVDRFKRRVATGGTGALLNDLAATMSPPRSRWVDARRSGPLGGDAEIALEVLENRCRYVLFFEDPQLVAHHEADALLVERAAWTMTERSVFIADRASAERWVVSSGMRAERSAQGEPPRRPPVRRAS